MPANAFSVGRDVKLDVNDPVLGPLRFSIVTGWNSVPQYEDLESKALDGLPRFDNVPHGHRLTFEVDRADSRLTDYFASREQSYFNGQIVPLVTITETITEIGGAVTTYRYTGISFKLTGGGDFKGNTVVKQTVEGLAARKYKV